MTRSATELSVIELREAAFVRQQKNLIGNVGTGKTHLATAIGIEACNKGMAVRFCRTATLVNQLSDAQKKGDLNKLLKQLVKIDLLICDERGYVPLDQDGAKLLFQVISDCYEQRSVVITVASG